MAENTTSAIGTGLSYHQKPNFFEGLIGRRMALDEYAPKAKAARQKQSDADYHKYINDINNNTGPVGQYKYLMDNYIQKTTAIWTIYEALPSLSFIIFYKSNNFH